MSLVNPDCHGGRLQPGQNLTQVGLERFQVSDRLWVIFLKHVGEGLDFDLIYGHGLFSTDRTPQHPKDQSQYGS